MYRIASRLLFALLLVLGFATQSPATLTSAGPVDPIHGFPQFYRGGVSIAPCLDIFDALGTSAGCVPFDPEPGIFNPSSPMVFPGNFPSEFFYWIAEPAFDVFTDPGDNVQQIRFALEGAFANEIPTAGQQIVFARKRFRVVVPVGATITIAHPYGTDTFTDGVAPDRPPDGEINVTLDEPVGIPLDFTGVLASTLIGPRLLRWDRTVPAPPAGYIGDFLVAHTVTGGRNRNSITITGGGLNLSTNLWFVAGKPFRRTARTFPSPGSPDNIIVSRAVFTSRNASWSVSGRGTVPGNTVTLSLGLNTFAVAAVGRTGVWRVLVRNSPHVPIATDVITATSNGGGTQSFPVNIR